MLFRRVGGSIRKILGRARRSVADVVRIITSGWAARKYDENVVRARRIN
jgi:hypothetical protein